MRGSDSKELSRLIMFEKVLAIIVMSAVLPMHVSFAEAPLQSPANVDPNATGPTDYRIGSGDVLSIMTYKEPEFSGSFQVRYDGKITMPLVGDIVAANRTPTQLSKQLEEQIGQFVELPRVTVAIATPQSAEYFVLGKVAKQGAFPYHRALRVAQALAIAGGFQEFAKKDDIVVIREVAGKQIHFSFNYDDFLGKKRLAGNLILLPGDTIVVP